ncbi:MAG TPA: energy transducer TonB, partial [bacterium]|nr:energy transducer TonB [bacterium]
MDKSFSRSFLESTLLHAALLLLLYFLYHSFITVQTPLLMDLTLIGQSSLGNGQGAPAAQSGQVPQINKTDASSQPAAPQKDTLNPAVDNSVRPEVAMKKVKKKSHHAPSEANLEKLNSSAPIGMEDQKAADSQIKTTEGVGSQAIAGAPDGSAQIEGQLAGRTILRQVNPVYPDWAQKQAIEATIKYQVTVQPSGLLKEDEIQLVQTSGYRDLDRVVYD